MSRYLMISGLAFGLVALAHLLRVALGWPVTVGTYSVPTWASIIAVMVFALLAGWAVRLSKQSSTS
jgi:hypothetical protein